MSLWVIIWCVEKIKVQKIVTIFIAMIVSFFLSTVLYFPEGVLNDWYKHVPFFTGQILFYFFLQEVIRFYSESNPTSRGEVYVAAGVSGAASTVGIADWFSFITEEGLQHIITLPLLLMVVIFSRLHFGSIKSKSVKHILNICIFAGFFLTVIHVGEFVVEAQGLLPMLESSIEIIEFLWYYLALIMFGVSIHKLSKLQPSIEK